MLVETTVSRFILPRLLPSVYANGQSGCSTFQDACPTVHKFDDISLKVSAQISTLMSNINHAALSLYILLLRA